MSELNGPELPVEPMPKVGEVQSVAPEVTIRLEQPGRSLWQKVKLGGAVVLAGLGAWGAYAAWQMIAGQDETNQYHSDITLKETKVYKDVALQLATFESTFHLKQDTVLDRADDAFIDWNPINYDTHIDTDVTTEVQSGVRVGRLTATRDDASGTLAVVIDGEITTSTPAVDWNKNSLPIEIGGMDIGVGTGEINKATDSANELIQAAGGIASACALRTNSVQELFATGVVDFLTSTSFADGIDPENITVTITDLDEQADTVYDTMVDDFEATKSRIKERYHGKENSFSVTSKNLTNCDKHTIAIVDSETTKR